MDSTIVTSEENKTIMNKPEFKKTGLGQRLKSAREAMQLSEKEAAARLHLNVSMIALIENENFAEGPPATFMRGYLRSYARLLRLSENEIALTLKELENCIPSSSDISAVPVISTKPQQYNDRYLRWLTYVIILGLITLVSMWWKSHSRYVIATVAPVQTKTDAAPIATTSSSETKPVSLPTAAATATTTSAVTPPTATGAATATTTEATTTPEAPITQTQSTTALPNASEPAASPAPTTPVTPTPTVSAAAKATKPASLPHLKMVLPEPDTE